jgi:hypothetical protein
MNQATDPVLFPLGDFSLSNRSDLKKKQGKKPP